MKIGKAFVALVATIGGITGVNFDAYGYEVTTHADLTKEAAVRANGLGDFLSMVGLSIDSVVDESMKMSVVEWIREGAVREDDTKSELYFRYKNHFYDPTKTAGSEGFGGILWRDSGIISGMPAPDWALDKGPDDQQFYSYSQARQYLFNALTQPAKGDRSKNLALLFRSLGQVVHVLEDMAQPQHTRNDGHGGGSYFEQLTDRKVIRDGFSKHLNQGVSIQAFSTAKEFFVNPSWTGLSQYSNGHFVSEGTNFRYVNGVISSNSLYPYPVPTGVVTFTVNDMKDWKDINGDPQIPAPIVQSCPDCTMSFVQAIGSSGETTERAATLSIFAQDIDEYGQNSFWPNPDVNPYVTLNKLNFFEAHDRLISRAVGYSAGLFNYFFRGKLEISLPDEGVYAIADHGKPDVYAKDSGGFTKVKLKLKNATPGTGGGVEPIGAGTLWAVAKFHRNTCYQPDLSGEYGAPDKEWSTCRAMDEEIVVSDAVAAPAGMDTAAQPLAFTFQTPIPINATDLYLQVVYRGQLGEETDAVVVATKDIAEPGFQLGYYNADEQFLYGPICTGCALATFKQVFCDSAQPPIPYDQCKYQYRYSYHLRFTPPTAFDPANPIASFGATVSLTDIPVSQYARIAVLADTGTFPVYAIGTNPVTGISENNYKTYSISAISNQKTPNTLIPATYLKARGVFGSPSVYQLLNYADPGITPPDFNPLSPLPNAVTINF